MVWLAPYTDEELISLRLQRARLINQIHGASRTLGLRDALILTALFSLSFQIIRWFHIPLNIVGHVYGIVSVVLFCQAVVFRPSRRMAAMCFGGGVYAIAFAVWHVDGEFWQIALAATWPVIYLIGCLVGITAGSVIHRTFGLLAAINARMNVTTPTSQADDDLTQSALSYPLVSDHATVESKPDLPRHSIDWHWLKSSGTVLAVVLFALNGICLFMQITSWIILTLQGFAWVLFGVQLFLAPSRARNEFEREVEVAQRGGFLLGSAAILQVLIMVAIICLTNPMTANAEIKLIVEACMGVVLCSLLFGACGLALGTVSAMILYGFMPDLWLFSKRIALWLGGSSRASDQV